MIFNELIINYKKIFICVKNCLTANYKFERFSEFVNFDKMTIIN